MSARISVRTAHGGPSRSIVLGLLACLGALSLIEIWLLILNGAGPYPHVFGFPGGNALVGLITAAVGAVIVWRLPKSWIGWALCVGGFFPFLTDVAGEYSVRAAQSHGGLPAGAFVGWMSDWVYLLGFGPMVLVLVLLFPDGKLPSRRWRPVAWFLGLVLLVAIPLDALSLGLYGVDLAGHGFPDPLSHDHHTGLLHDLIRGTDVLSNIVGLPAALAALTAPIVRVRRATGKERQQLKWFAYAAVSLVVYDLFFLSAPVNLLEGVLESLVLVTQASFPLVVAIAIMRYDLYDIDLVITKTVVFGALAAFITAVYVAIVVGLGTLVGTAGKPNLALAILATAVVAVAFEPVREQVQRFANQLVYGKRATPYEVLSQFSDRVADVFASEEVLARMARVVGEGTGAQRAYVWLRVGPEIVPTAAWPEQDGAKPGPIQVTGQLLPVVERVTRLVPVRHQDELLGALSISKAASEPLTPVEDKLLSDLAGQAGLVLRNVRLTAELQARLAQISEQAVELRASRQRIVAAQDAERRRLERNIHDGAQQNLVALTIKLRLAAAAAKRDPQRAHALVRQLETDAVEALRTLRDLAQGIYPSVLRDRGLVEALQQHAEVTSDGVGRYDGEIEAAIYFACLEAIQNATKHAQASTIHLDLKHEGDDLAFRVVDDGAGFDPERVQRGSGLQNMRDRLQALGGNLEITSRPGHGTRVQGRIPAQAVELVVA